MIQITSIHKNNDFDMYALILEVNGKIDVATIPNDTAKYFLEKWPHEIIDKGSTVLYFFKTINNATDNGNTGNKEY